MLSETEVIDEILVREAYNGVRSKTRTKADLRRCGCVNCQEALKRLKENQ